MRKIEETTLLDIDQKKQVLRKWKKPDFWEPTQKKKKLVKKKKPRY